jgi:hypothetical protein
MKNDVGATLAVALVWCPMSDKWQRETGKRRTETGPGNEKGVGATLRGRPASRYRRIVNINLCNPRQNLGLARQNFGLVWTVICGLIYFQSV